MFPKCLQRTHTDSFSPPACTLQNTPSWGAGPAWGKEETAQGSSTDTVETGQRCEAIRDDRAWALGAQSSSSPAKRPGLRQSLRVRGGSGIHSGQGNSFAAGAARPAGQRRLEGGTPGACRRLTDWAGSPALHSTPRL